MENKIPVYVRIDEDTKNRASLYATKCKLLKRETDTMSKLIEEALEQFMILNSL